jgi:hypothetical protein
MRWPPSSYGFGFQVDVTTRLLDQGLTYLQVPCVGIDRKGKSSTALTMRNLLSVCHTLLEVAARRLRRQLYGKGTPRAREVFARE